MTDPATTRPIGKQGSRRLPLRRSAAVLTVWLALFVAGIAPAQIRHEMIPCVPKKGELGRNLYRFAPTDTIEIVARRGLYGGRGSAFRFPSLAELGPVRQEPVPAAMLLRRPTFRLSRLGCAIYGADRMAGTAAALGGLGMVGGIWGEKTTGYLMGAGAILGALWGSTAGADDPGFRIRVDASRSEP